MRLAAHAPNFDCDQFVLRWLDNVGPRVEKVYIAYPDRPWVYNPRSREALKNRADPSLVLTHKFGEKVEIVRGDWPTEEETRNECLEKARKEGFDFLIVQDLDEFYTEEEFRKNIEEMEEVPGFCVYCSPCHVFWRDIRHILRFRDVRMRQGKQVLFHEKGGTIFYLEAFALNCKADVRFASKRTSNKPESKHLLKGICCHLSMVLSDDSIQLKLRTWGHAAQVKKQWFRYKWQGWRPQSRCIGYTNPARVLGAEEFKGELPPEIADFSPGQQVLVPLTQFERCGEICYDIWYIIYYHLRRAWGEVRLRVR